MKRRNTKKKFVKKGRTKKDKVKKGRVTKKKIVLYGGKKRTSLKKKEMSKKTTEKNKEISKKKLQCSANESSNSFSCYNREQLLKLKEYWNLRYPKNKINSVDPYEIWQKLSYLMKNICNTDDCWLRQKFVTMMNDKNLTFEEIYAPIAPKKWKRNKNEWLNSLDILHVMKSYEKKNKHFDFIGPSPIDFDKRLQDGECVWNELCNFELSKSLKKGKTDIGFIFNTDYHDEPGSHWVSMHVKLNIKEKDGYIFYFDSVGDEVPSEIIKLQKRIQQQGQKLGYKLRLMDTSGFRHQYKTTECGVYGIYFIVSLMKNIHSAEYWQKNRIPDHEIEKYRKIFWNKI